LHPAEKDKSVITYREYGEQTRMGELHTNARQLVKWLRDEHGVTKDYHEYFVNERPKGAGKGAGKGGSASEPAFGSKPPPPATVTRDPQGGNAASSGDGNAASSGNAANNDDASNVSTPRERIMFQPRDGTDDTDGTDGTVATRRRESHIDKYRRMFNQ